MNTYTTGDQSSPALASVPGRDDFLVAWRGAGPGDEDGISSRRHILPEIFENSFEEGHPCGWSDVLGLNARGACRR